jgi:hypothetical protein
MRIESIAASRAGSRDEPNTAPRDEPRTGRMNEITEY